MVVSRPATVQSLISSSASLPCTCPEAFSLLVSSITRDSRRRGSGSSTGRRATSMDTRLPSFPRSPALRVLTGTSARKSMPLELHAASREPKRARRPRRTASATSFTVPPSLVRTSRTASRSIRIQSKRRCGPIGDVEGGVGRGRERLAQRLDQARCGARGLLERALGAAQRLRGAAQGPAGERSAAPDLVGEQSKRPRARPRDPAVIDRARGGSPGSRPMNEPRAGRRRRSRRSGSGGPSRPPRSARPRAPRRTTAPTWASPDRASAT